MSDRDYYEILGLTPVADGAMVDQAYWHLARKYQLLGTTNPRARHMLDELNEAYGVIGASKLRQQYDAFRDDVLITGGIIKPVKSSAKPEERSRGVEATRERRPRRAIPFPEMSNEHWRTYATSAVIAALALAGAWQGVNPAFVITALVAGLVFSLTPALRRQIPDLELPSVTIPEFRTPRVSMPRLGEANIARLRELGVGTPKDEPLDPGDLHASTAAMISRWRNSVGLRPLGTDNEASPSTTLVDIVESERDLDEQSAPLSAVIDILRGAHRPIETR